MYNKEEIANLKVCAVTVTFNPDLSIFRSQVHSLREQCALIVADNGSAKTELTGIRDIVKDHPRAHLIELPGNLGIAAAQNRAKESASSLGWNVSYFLTLDHDSVPGKSFVENLVNMTNNLQRNGTKVAVVGPVLFDPRSGSRLKLHRIEGLIWKKLAPEKSATPIEVSSVNSSGSLILASALEECGQFDESLFIDHVETEWCFRALSSGWKIFIDSQTEMEHRMGDDVVKYWLWGWREMPYRSPSRHYYIVRNSLSLLKRPYVPAVWKFWSLVKILFTLTYFGMAASDSTAQRAKIFRGIKDGWKGKSGALNAIRQDC